VLELTVSAPHPKLFVAFCTFKNNNMKFTVLLFICLSVLFGCGKGSVPAANIEAAKSEQPVLTQVVEAVASDSGNVYSGEIRARHEVNATRFPSGDSDIVGTLCSGKMTACPLSGETVI
jgi:hypothetical protein